MLDDLIAEIARLGYSLRLSGPLLDRPLRYRWEASVTRALASDPPTFAVGFHPAPDPHSALTRALDRCANDFELHQPIALDPTCAVDDSITQRLSNLLTQPTQPTVLSPLKFKFKT